MKSLFTLLFSLTFFALFAQNSTATINISGTRNKELIIDSKTYTVSSSKNTTGSYDPIIISDLLPGQHSLKVVKINSNNTRKNISSKTFNTKDGFDVAINISNEGTVQVKENSIKSRISRKAPMSDVNFNILLKDAKRQWIPGAKMTAASNAFSNPNNYFTTAQARELILLVNDEGNRVLLAKTAYRTIVDPSNFNKLYDLFENQISKDNLTAFVKEYNNTGNKNGNSTTSNEKVAMSDTRFNDLLRSAEKQWVPGAKMTAATNAFSNPNNYFTTNQARQLITLVNEETNRLQLAKSSYRSIVDPSNFSQLYEIFSNQANRDNLVAYVNSYNSGVGSSGVGTSGTGGTTKTAAMTDANFSVLLKEAQGQWMPGGKMTSATNAFSNKNYYFTTAQARQLIIMVDDESNRLQLAKLSYRSIVDPSNFNQVSEVLTSQVSKNDLAAFVSSYNATNVPVNTTTTKRAMPDAEFGVIIDNVKRQWIPGSRLTVISNEFSNPENHFTVYQARQLIQYINDEANRLTLAKSSYKTIVDPANFSQLYDLFTTQKSKDELAAYVRANK